MAFFPLPLLKSQTPAEPPAMVSNVGREDVLWDRPVFRAPPLEPKLPHLSTPPFTDGLRRIGLLSR